MIEPEGFTFNPAEPGNETKLRAAKSHETPRAADEPNIAPAKWNVGDDLGDFVIEAAIGSGVTSSVYRVRERATGQTFAMKILRTRSEEMLTASRVGFRRIQRLRHPSLVRCDRMLLVGDNLAFTMEEVVGKRLLDVIAEARADDRAATYQLAMHLLHAIGGALQAIHAAGLVHRDVKPDNVMIDQHGRARLVDYGLVGSYDPVSDPDAKRGYLAGTYWYMAPESISQQIYPPACDVYSLGCMLLELVADRNRLPSVVDGSSLGESLGSVQDYLPSDIPEELGDLICDMIDPLPENRPVAARLVQVKRRPEPLDRAPSNFTDGLIHGRANALKIAETWIQSVIDGRPKRLHISGDSGVGKTWFLQEMLRRLRSIAWFQAFDSTCRERSDVSLQAFDAMADAIARRYSRDDREKLRLAPRHAAVLRQAFPSLRSVITEPYFQADDSDAVSDLGLRTGPLVDKSASAADIARSDALLAGVELIDRMCDYGPVFLVLDDIQWADADSIHVLDKVLNYANGNTGIITVGRSREDRFREPADCYIELEPLTETDAIALLRRLLSHCEFQWSELALKRLAMLGDGNPYCLTQLAACVGHDDANRWHDQMISSDVNIEDIWQSRVNQLSDVAQVAIEFLAVAGGPTPRSELAPASNLREQCERALKELIEVRLVYDEAPKRDAVNIIHQRVARSIVGAIDPTRYRSLHSAWANHLMQGPDIPWHAARIAGHLLKAGEPESAIPYIIQAARDAEARFAFTEAARWHHRVASQLTGTQSAIHWMETVQCFEEAACPGDAADACRILLLHPAAATVKWSETTVRHHLAMNLLRSGKITEACDTIDSISSRFDPDWNRSLAATRRQKVRQAFCRERLSRTNDSKSILAEVDSAYGDVDLQSDALDACIALYKPLFAFDIEIAFELLIKILSAIGDSTPSNKPEILLDALVVGCRNPGPRRRRHAEWLNRAVEDGDATGSAALISQANCAVAMRHLAACDWASTINASLKSINAFRSLGQQNRFGDALARLPMNWSCLWLGRLRDLRSNVSTMTCDADERNDQSVMQLVQLGPGSAVELMSDNDHRRALSGRPASAFSSPWTQILGGFSQLMKWQYEGEFECAARYHRMLVNSQRKTLIKQCQFLRVLAFQYEASIHIGNASQRPADRDASIAVVQRVCQDLRKERIGYANAIKTYFQAQVLELVGDLDQSATKYVQAAAIADSQGLIPLKLAANDRFAKVLGESNCDNASELDSFLASEGVKVPGKFARIYCGLR